MLYQRRARIAALVAAAGLAAAGLGLVGARSARTAPARASAARPVEGRAGGPSSTVAAPVVEPSTTAAPSRSPAQAGSISFTATRGARRIGVVVWYPAHHAGPGAAPLARPGRYPLIVFSPGFDVDPGVYDALVTHWVVLGFVVAVADYPFTAESSPGGVDEADIIRHPADLEAVIDQVLDLSVGPGGPLSGLVERSGIGVAGQSDGGDVTDAVASNSCCRDPRIRAAAVLSGAELSSFGGTYRAPGVPLLVTQGDADAINAPACSEQIYDQAGLPRFYLDLRGAGHLPPYTPTAGGVLYQDAVERVSGLFWQAYLMGDTSALAELKAGAGLTPLTPLTVGGPVPERGTCPGAP